MASPSTVITLGYGSFGSVNLIPTLGYGVRVVTVTPSLWFTLGNQRTEFTLPKAPDVTNDDNATEFTLETP